MPRVKRHEIPISATVPVAMAERLERIAPTAESRRSEFIRQAIEAALEQAEGKLEQASDSAA